MGDYIDNQLTGRSVDKDWFSFVDINVIVWQQFCHFPAALDLQSEYNIRFILKWNKKNGYLKTDKSGFNYFCHLIKVGVTQYVRVMASNTSVSRISSLYTT